jgi:hypothetical protein
MMITRYVPVALLLATTACTITPTGYVPQVVERQQPPVIVQQPQQAPQIVVEQPRQAPPVYVPQQPYGYER